MLNSGEYFFCTYVLHKYKKMKCGIWKMNISKRDYGKMYNSVIFTNEGTGANR